MAVGFIAALCVCVLHARSHQWTTHTAARWSLECETMLRFQHIYNSTYCHSSTPPLSISHFYPLLSFLLPPISPTSSIFPGTIPLIHHLPPPGLSFSFTSPTLPFSSTPSLLIIFPGARDGISRSYASAQICNMLAHDNIVSLSASCRERKQASINIIHRPTVTGSTW